MNCSLCESEIIYGLKSKNSSIEFPWCDECSTAYPYGLDKEGISDEYIYRVLGEKEWFERIKVEEVKNRDISNIQGLTNNYLIGFEQLLDKTDFPVIPFFSMVDDDQFTKLIISLLEKKEYSYKVCLQPTAPYKKSYNSCSINQSGFVQIDIFSDLECTISREKFIYYSKVAVDKYDYYNKSSAENKMQITEAYQSFLNPNLV